MRRSPFLALTGLVAAAAAAGAADLPAVKTRGALRVLAVHIKEPDVFFQFSGRPGFDRELLEGFAALHRVRLEPVAVASWEDLVPALLAEKGDVIAGGFTVTAERERRVAFTREAFPSRNVVLTPASARCRSSSRGRLDMKNG
jgi:ABC-type amino acid transport substrate-binding protein